MSYYLANCTTHVPIDFGSQCFKGSGEILMCLPLVSILIHLSDRAEVTWGFSEWVDIRMDGWD